MSAGDGAVVPRTTAQTARTARTARGGSARGSITVGTNCIEGTNTIIATTIEQAVYKMGRVGLTSVNTHLDWSSNRDRPFDLKVDD